MTTTARTTAIGVFTEPGMADRAIDVLSKAGFKDDQIGYVTRHGADTHELASDHESHSSVPGAAAGALGGGVIGGILGAAVSLLIPGLGPALAAGVLVTTIGGAAIGAVAGGFTGALVSSGVPEEEAQYYQDQLIAGRTLVMVTAPDRYQEAVKILRECGASDAEVRDDVPQVNDGGSKLGYPADFVPVVAPNAFAGGAGVAQPAAPIAYAGAMAATHETSSDEQNAPVNEPADEVDGRKPYAGATAQRSEYDTDPDLELQQEHLSETQPATASPANSPYATNPEMPQSQPATPLVARKVQSQRSEYDTDPEGLSLEQDYTTDPVQPVQSQPADANAHPQQPQQVPTKKYTQAYEPVKEREQQY